MTSQTSVNLANSNRRMKSVPAAGAFLLIGVAIFASQAAFQPANGSAQPKAAEQIGDAPAHTVKAVAVADKFLKGLDDKLRAKAVYEFNSDKRPRWSNLPNVPRNGVRIGELSKEQREAAMEVVASVTSKDGYQKILDIVAADDSLVKGGGKGGKGGKGGGGFGFDNFFFALFGTPSTKEPWLVQFGGHHLAVNVTVVGKDFVLTPTLTCAQPSSFTKDGKTIRPLGLEHDLGFKLIASLDETQRAKAILKNGTKDLLLGPGKDGKEIQPEGLKGADMNEKQQALLAELAGAWVNIVHEESAKERMAEIKAKLNDTYFAWSGPTAEGSAAYFRVQGPTVVIEYAPQGGVNHIHTIVRDLGNDYGKKLVRK